MVGKFRVSSGKTSIGNPDSDRLSCNVANPDYREITKTRLSINIDVSMVDDCTIIYDKFPTNCRPSGIQSLFDYNLLPCDVENPDYRDLTEKLLSINIDESMVDENTKIYDKIPTNS